MVIGVGTGDVGVTFRVPGAEVMGGEGQVSGQRGH